MLPKFIESTRINVGLIHEFDHIFLEIIAVFVISNTVYISFRYLMSITIPLYTTSRLAKNKVVSLFSCDYQEKDKVLCVTDVMICITTTLLNIKLENSHCMNKY